MPEIGADDLSSQVDSLYEQHLKTKLRTARRNLAHTVEVYMRTPDNPQLNERVDEASREVALIERELTVYRARSRENQSPAPPADDARREHEATPSEAFRAAQLAKATQAIRAGVFSAPQTDARGGESSAARDVSAITAELDDPPVVPPPNTASPAPPPVKTCPKCGGNAPIEARRCACGYSFAGDAASSGDDFLTREEVLALRRGSRNPSS
jgi:hypothetical protein